MAVTFSELTDMFAAEVYGIDIAAGVDAADVAEVVRLFNTYSVLVFPGQDIDDEQQIRFSQSLSDIGNFGGLEGTVLTNEGAGSQIAIISNVDLTSDSLCKIGPLLTRDPPVDLMGAGLSDTRAPCCLPPSTRLHGGLRPVRPADADWNATTPGC